MAHDDTLAIGRDHDHLALLGHRARLFVVEGREVGGRSSGELLHLSLADDDSSGPFDRLLGLLERPTGRLDGRELAEPVGVELVWQVQGGVCRIEVRHLPAAVGEAARGDRADDRGERPLVVALDGPTATPAASVTPSRRTSLSARRSKWSWRSWRQRLEAGGLNVVLELGVLKASRHAAVEEPADRVELGGRGGEDIPAVGLDALVRPRHLRRENRATSSASPALPCASRRTLADLKRSVALRTDSTSAAGSIKNFVLPPSL